MTIDSFFKRYDYLRSLLQTMGLSNQRVELLLLMMQMNLYYHGPITASAKWLAGMTRCNEKTVDRLLAWLKSEGLAEVTRLKRPDGYWSVNQTSLLPFIKKLSKLLRPALEHARAKVSIAINHGRTYVTVNGWFPGGRLAGWCADEDFVKLPTGRTSLLWRLDYL